MVDLGKRVVGGETKGRGNFGQSN